MENKEWLRKAWNDGGYRAMIYFLIIAGAFFTAGISLYSREFNPVGLLFWAFIPVVVIPLTYLMRNNR